jgi:hypothetical protein
MDFNTTIDIIIKDLRQAREIINDLKQYPGVPLLQVELAVSKCRSAEEIMALLKTMKQEHQVMYNEEVERVEGVESDERIDEVKFNTPSDRDILMEIDDEDEDESFSLPVPEKKVSEVSNLLVDEKHKTDDETDIPKKSREKLPETNIIADRFSGMSNTFNEQLGNTKSDGDVSASIKSRPVNNLTEAIGINDKFLFIREIFNGNQLSYNEAIAKLNKIENISDARAVIMSYTGEGDENEAVKQLLDLVKRKLPADE